MDDDTRESMTDISEALSAHQQSIHAINDRLDVLAERVDFAMQAIYDLQRNKANREMRACI